MRAWKIAVPILLIGFGGWFAQRKTGTLIAKNSVPTAEVQQGNLKLDVRTTGELQTEKNVTLFAPQVGGGSLRIVHLSPDGSQVKPGEMILQFDPSEQEYNLEKNRSDLQQGEQEIAKAKAQAEVQDSDDRLALLKAKFAVRKAELQVQKNPILPAIDAQKNVLALDEAKRALAQLQQDIKSHSESNEALLRVAQAKYDKAKGEMVRAEENIKNMTIASPIPGLVKVRQNFQATGGFRFSGMTIPEFHEGDQAEPGAPIADVLDMSQMEILGKISETDRPGVEVGEPVEIRVDAIPGEVFHGKVKTVAGMAVNMLWEASPTRRFDLLVEIDKADPRLRPGFTAQLRLLGDEVKDALYIPRVAIFEKDGKPIVYLKKGGDFVEHDVKLETQTSAWAVVKGLTAGNEVALVNPVARSESKSNSQAGPAIQGAGR